MTESQTKPCMGGCHCGAVRFEADIDLAGNMNGCNCTMCVKRAGLNALIEPIAFRLTAGKEVLSEYAWGFETGPYYFCKTCGIGVFREGNVPELGGAYVAVNVRCIDGIDPEALKVVYWDGRHDNWAAGTRDTPWPVNAPVNT